MNDWRFRMHKWQQGKIVFQQEAGQSQLFDQFLCGTSAIPSAANENGLLVKQIA